MENGMTMGDCLRTNKLIILRGNSGSGKTTLLNVILGITDCDCGQILFDGKDITKVSMEERGFNIVFQDYALFPNLNAYQNITYGLRNKPAPDKDNIHESRQTAPDCLLYWFHGS